MTWTLILSPDWLLPLTRPVTTTTGTVRTVSWVLIGYFRLETRTFLWWKEGWLSQDGFYNKCTVRAHVLSVAPSSRRWNDTSVFNVSAICNSYNVLVYPGCGGHWSSPGNSLVPRPQQTNHSLHFALSMETLNSYSNGNACIFQVHASCRQAKQKPVRDQNI